MKTTVDISDTLLQRLRTRAVKDRTTMRELFDAALRQFLAPGRPRNGKFKLRDGSFRGPGSAPGILEGDWEKIREIIYEGRGGFPDAPGTKGPE